MESFLYYRFYSFNLNDLLDACIVEIPRPWQIERGYFAESTLYYKKILARIMLMEMINNAFTPFDPVKAGIVNEKLTYEGLSISVSYSGDLILVTASAQFVVGVDVEEIRSRDMSLFQKVFRPEEWKWMDNAWHRWEAFYELWTRKEAALKADGRGLGVDLYSVGVISETVTLPSSDQIWNLVSFVFLRKFVVSMAVSVNFFKVQIFESQSLPVSK